MIRRLASLFTPVPVLTAKLSEIRRTCLWLVVVLPLGGAAPAVAEEDFSKWVEEEVETLREQILATAQLPGGEGVAPLADQPVPLWVKRAFIGSNDVYSGEGFRYAVLRVCVGNRTEQDLVFRRERLSLKTETQTYAVGPGNMRQFRHAPLEIDWTPEQHPRPQTLLETPAKLTVRPGKAVTFWAVFFGLESTPVVPAMTLQLQPEGGELLTLDVNWQQNARLGLTQSAIGPSGCLTVLTIHGQLNRVNSALLAQRLTQAQQAGAQRFLLEWESAAQPSDEVLFGWLAATTSAERNENPLLMQLPALPELRKIALCRLPEGNEDALEWEEGSRSVFATSQEGATALLKEVYERVSTETVLREIQSGHPWSRRAALQTAGARLGTEAVPLLRELADSDDPDVRRDTILALGFQPQATPFLTQRLLGENPVDAVSALEALVAVATIERQEQVAALLDDPRMTIPRHQVLRSLANAYHPAWDRYLTSCVRDDDPAVRAAALEVLQQLGHSELDRFCVAALNDGEEAVRNAAFQALRRSTDRASRQAALAYTLKQLENNQLTLAGLALIEEMRATAAAPQLIAQLQKPEVPRFRLIEVIGQIGTDGHCRQVLEQLSLFNDDEQLMALDLATQLPLEFQLKVARQSAASSSPTVREGAIGILRRLASEEAVQVLGEMIAKADDDQVADLAYALGEIGTDAAVKQLRQFRAQARSARNVRHMQVVDAGLREWRRRLPGWNFVESGNMHVMGDELEEAIKAYTLALLINPNLPDAYSMRGNTHLRRDQFDAAGTDFQKALDLDPYDSQAVTGVAIVQAIHGDWEQAIQFVRERADLFPNDRYYPYNTACVLARGIESIRKGELRPEDKQRILELQEEAIQQLKVSISHGFNQFDWMQKDPDLASIRDLPEFKKLIREED